MLFKATCYLAFPPFISFSGFCIHVSCVLYESVYTEYNHAQSLYMQIPFPRHCLSSAAPVMPA